MRTSLLLRKLSDQLFEISLRGSHVFDLLRTRNFPLDGDRAAIVYLFHPRDDPRKIHLTFANGNLVAQLPRVRGHTSVLGVNPQNVLADRLEVVSAMCTAL